MATFLEYEKQLHDLRKEPKTVDLSPIVTREKHGLGSIEVINDYSEGLLLISLAAKELDEACPNGQAARLALSLKALTVGLHRLHQWAKAKGVVGSDVSTASKTIADHVHGLTKHRVDQVQNVDTSS